jgi:hypothetical protein
MLKKQKIRVQVHTKTNGIIPREKAMKMPEKSELALCGLGICKRSANTRRRVEPIDISMMRKLKGVKLILKMGKNGTKVWQNGPEKDNR